jgi:hypothetical protein
LISKPKILSFRGESLEDLQGLWDPRPGVGGANAQLSIFQTGMPSVLAVSTKFAVTSKPRAW